MLSEDLDLRRCVVAAETQRVPTGGLITNPRTFLTFTIYFIFMTDKFFTLEEAELSILAIYISSFSFSSTLLIIDKLNQTTKII